MKHKRRWSDLGRWAATCVCGLLLLNLPAPAWAAQKKQAVAVNIAKVAKKPVGKVISRHKVPAKSLAKGRNPSKKRQTSHAAPAPAVGMAEMREADDVGLRGAASFYGHAFQGRRVATGERFDVRAFTAASNHFPLGSWVAVRRLDDERCAIVKVNDRMSVRHQRRIIDVSRGAAEYLGMIRSGVVLVRVAPLKSASRMAKNCRAAFDVLEDCPDCSALQPLQRWPTEQVYPSYL